MANVPVLGDESKEALENTLVKQVAALSLTGASEQSIADKLGISRYGLRKIRNGEAFKAELKDIADKASQLALSQFKSKLEQLEPLAFKALKKNLEENKLEAVRIFAEFAGIKDKQAEATQDSNITIMMPGAVPPPKDVPNE